jgi:radical SAM protein with 4Fe4S-binding SPASM domain
MECCRDIWPDNEEYLRDFNRKVVAQRVPLNGNFDLTHRCNLRCTHCYLAGPSPDRKNSGRELDTRQWRAVIDEITQAGCLYLLLTGGEPLLREDFADIYRCARTSGLLVTVFTNGTLISPNILELFREFPPRAVEITLYGATAGTYEAITGVKGSYQRCLEGIRGLKDHGVNVRLKTILMGLNRHEFHAIEGMAREWGLRFRFDAALFPRLNGDPSPIDLRVPPQEAVEKEFSDRDRFRQYRDFFERFKDVPLTDSLYQCGAGRTHFHIDPYGNLQPCLMVRNLSYNLESGGFLTGWNEVMPRLRDVKPGTAYRCNQCQKRSLCGFCPGFFKLEKDAEDLPSEYLCEMGQLRFEKINEII